MCYWKNWIWPGFLTIAIVSALAIWMKSDAIEQDLIAKAESAFSSNGHDWAKVEMDGRDATLMGSSPNDVDQSSAFTGTITSYGVRVVDNKTDLISAVSPYTFKIARKGSQLDLTGHVPSNKFKMSLMASIKELLPLTKVEDNLVLARGANDSFAPTTTFGLEQLALMESGEISLKGADFSVSGEPLDRATYDKILNNLDQSVPDGSNLVLRQISAPVESPYTIEAKLDEEKLILSGFAPTQEMVSVLQSNAGKLLPGKEIENSLLIASKPPENFLNSANFGLEQLSRLSEGKVLISDNEFSISGKAKTPDDYVVIQTKLKQSLPTQLVIKENNLSPADVTNYFWQAERDESRITLNGFVPNIETRAKIISQSRGLTGISYVEDNLKLATGASENFQITASYGIGLFEDLSKGTVSLGDGGLAIKGLAKTVTSYSNVLKTLAEKRPTDVSIASQDIKPVSVSPYVWAADFNGDSLIIKGNVPNEEIRANIMGDAKISFPEANLKDEMAIAAGEPEAFQAFASFSLMQLAKLSSGNIEQEDNKLSIEGTAKDPLSYRDVQKVLQDDLPFERELSLNKVVPATVAPYRWSAEFDGTSLNVSGNVPDENSKRSIVNFASQSFPGIAVSDETLIAVGAPVGFQTATSVGLEQLASMSSGEINLSETDYSISGVAKSVDAYSLLTAEDALIPDGYNLASKSIQPSTVSPYNWSGNFDGKTLKIEGFVPDVSTRMTLLDSAKNAFPNAAINDETQIAAGAPDEFRAAVLVGFEQLADMSSGKIGLSDTDYSVSGVAKSVGAYGVLNSASASAPAGYNLASKSIQPSTVSPYTWSANFDGKTLKTEGYVPDENAQKSILASAKETFPNVTFSDETQIAAGAPDGFKAAASVGFKQLTEMSSGKIDLFDTDYSVSGVAKSIDAYETLTAENVSAPAGYNLASRSIQPSTLSPYIWSADYDGRALILDGVVPDGVTKASIMGAAKGVFPSASIEDKTRLAAGEPKGFVGSTGYALGELSKLSSGKAGLSDRAYSISGTAKTPENFALLGKASTNALPNDLELSSSNISAPTVSPYSWSADLSEGVVKLKGFTPDEEARKSIFASVEQAVTGAIVNDEMLIASGAPQDFVASADYGLKQFKHLSSGSVRLDDQELLISGVAKDAEAYKDSESTANAILPNGVTVKSRNVVPATVSPYVWSADFDGTKVDLKGFVPNSDSRDALVEATKKAVPTVEINDNTLIAAGAPEGFNEASTFAIGRLSSLSKGSVSLSGLDLSVGGTAKNPSSYAENASALKSTLPAGLMVSKDNVKPSIVSPYEWSAAKNGNVVTLDGYVPNEPFRKSVMSMVEDKVSGANVVDKMQIAAGEPDDFKNSVNAGIAIMPRLASGRVGLSNGTLSLAGTAKSSEDYLAILATSKGKFEIDTTLAPPKVIGDYVWSAQKSDTQIVLRGSVPSVAEHGRIVEAAKVISEGREPDDQLDIATGAPLGFAENVDKGMSLLGMLSEGHVSIKNQELSISGVANSVLDYEKATKSIATDVNAGNQWGQRAISAPVVNPYSWSITSDQNKTNLSGFIPNRGLGNTNVGAAETVIGGNVTDNQRIASGAPTGFGNVTAALIGAVSRLEIGNANLTGTRVSIQGRASSKLRAESVKIELRSALSDQFKLREQITYPAPEPVKQEPKDEPEVTAVPQVCTVDFAKLFDGEKVQFATARAAIKSESFDLLNRIAADLKKCNESKIEIGGHTDSRGRDAYNLKLSEARARAVMDYFLKTEIAPENLESKGYGETQPVATNDTVDGRAANRRIELKLLSAD